MVGKLYLLLGVTMFPDTYLMSQSNCSLMSEQPKSVVQAWPMVNLWNFSMSMTPT